MSQYANHGGTYMGDQGFIWDAMDRKVPFLTDALPGFIRSYRRHCALGVPENCSIVAFGGPLKPHNQKDAWIKEAWQ
jgi:hypothetical protein